MSERQSILRLKVVGTETVKNDLSQIEAAGFRTARNLQRAYDVARQTTPRTPEGIAARETVRDIEKQLVGQHILWKMTDQAITAQRRLQLEAGKAETGRGTSAAMIQQGAFSALTAMGSRRILRQGAGMVAQQMIGAAGIGQEVGLAIGGFLYGGLGLGTIAMVGATAAAYYRKIAEDAKAVKTIEAERLELHKKINETLREEAENTPLGKKYESAAKEAEASADANYRRIQELRAEEGMFGHVTEAMKRIGGGKPDEVRRLLTKAMEEDRAKSIELAAIAKAEAPFILRYKSEDQDLRAYEARIGAMAAGPRRDEQALSLERSREMRTIARHAEERTRAAMIIKDEEERAAKLKEIETERQVAVLSGNRVYAYKLQGFQQKQADDRLALERSAEDAHVNLTLQGYERDQQNMVNHYRRLWDDRKKAGKEVEVLERQAADSLTALSEAHARENEARVAKISRDIYEQIRFTTYQIENVTGAFNALGPSGLARRKMELEYPGVSPVRIWNKVEADRRLQLAQSARQQITAAHPLAMYAEFKRDIDEKMSFGLMGKGEANAQLQAYLRKVIGPGSGGQYMDAVGYVHHIQSALLKGDDVTKEQLAEMRGLNEKLTVLIREGMPIKAGH